MSEIVVTGSRIARRDYSSDSPIVTMNQVTLQQSGQVTLEAALMQLPQFMSATTEFTPQNRTGRAAVNLRGLGEQRSLVLLDGRRVVPATASGVVDINILPSALVQSVETITGGASAVYGSEAMAGVVNFKLKNRYQGLDFDAQVNAPYHGRGVSEDVSATFGQDFDDGRGNVMVLLDFANRGELQRKDRDFTQVSTLIGRIYNPIVSLSANPPSQAAVDSVFAQYGAAPGTVNRTTTLGVNTDGSLFTPAPGNGHQIVNYKGPLGPDIVIYNNAIQANSGYDYDLIAPLQRGSGYGKFQYELTPHLKAFAEVLGSVYETTTHTGVTQIGSAGTSATISANNPFIPADLRTILDSRAHPSGSIPVTYSFTQLGQQSQDTTTKIGQVTVGLSGDVPGHDLTWEVYGSYGRTSQHMQWAGAVSLSAIQGLLGASDGGASLCSGGFNVFGPAADVSQSCLDYVTHNPWERLTLQEGVVEADVQGKLLSLPAGDLRFAAGADFRSDSVDYTQDPLGASGDIIGDNDGAPYSGSRNLAEVYGELLVPIVRDLPLFKKLEADLGYRYSHYQISGGASSYTANLEWTLVDFVKLRGGYSRAIRAPSLLDMFAPSAPATLRLGTPTSGTTNGDPCDVRSSYRTGANSAQVRQLCLAMGVPSAAIDTYTFNSTTVYGTSSGNPELHPETADTYSLGVVLKSPVQQPAFAGLSASADYYSISVNGAVGQLPLATALARCFNTDGVSNPNYSASNSNCLSFPRNPSTGNMNNAVAPVLNLAAYRTSGVDLEVDWQLHLADLGLPAAGTVRLNLVGTYLDSFKIQTLQNTPVLDYAGSSQSPIDPNGRPSVLPRWKSVATLGYTRGLWNASVRWRYVGPVKDASIVTNASSKTPGAPSVSYFDVFGQWRLNQKLELRAGVNNLFDKQPPVLSAIPGNTDFNTYDIVGRAFYVGVNARF